MKKKNNKFNQLPAMLLVSPTFIIKLASTLGFKLRLGVQLAALISLGSDGFPVNENHSKNLIHQLYFDLLYVLPYPSRNVFRK